MRFFFLFSCLNVLAQAIKNSQVSTSVNCENYGLNFIKFNLPMALDVLFCKDLIVNAENSPVSKIPCFFQNILLSHHFMDSRYGEIP